MLVDDKTEHRPPPDYFELPPDHYYRQEDDWPPAGAATTSTGARARARNHSVLYGDMNDPFSNHAAVPSTSGVRDADYDDGHVGNQNTHGSSPPRGVDAGASTSTTLHAVSPHSFEYVAPEDIPDDASFRGRRRSSSTDPTDAAVGVSSVSTKGPRGPRPLSTDSGRRGSFYDTGLYDRERGIQRSPTNSLGDASPLVDRYGAPSNSISSRNLLGGEADGQHQHRGMQPLGARLVNLRPQILTRRILLDCF